MLFLRLRASDSHYPVAAFLLDKCIKSGAADFSENTPSRLQAPRPASERPRTHDQSARTSTPVVNRPFPGLAFFPAARLILRDSEGPARMHLPRKKMEVHRRVSSRGCRHGAFVRRRVAANTDADGVASVVGNGGGNGSVWSPHRVRFLRTRRESSSDPAGLVLVASPSSDRNHSNWLLPPTCFTLKLNAE
jgi:hypothetical protein